MLPVDTSSSLCGWPCSRKLFTKLASLVMTTRCSAIDRRVMRPSCVRLAAGRLRVCRQSWPPARPIGLSRLPYHLCGWRRCCGGQGWYGCYPPPKATGIGVTTSYRRCVTGSIRRVGGTVPFYFLWLLPLLRRYAGPKSFCSTSTKRCWTWGP